MDVCSVWALSPWLTPRLSRAVSSSRLSRGPAPRVIHSAVIVAAPPPSSDRGPLVGCARRQEKRERRRLDARHRLGDQHQPICVFVLFNRRIVCCGHRHLERCSRISGLCTRPGDNSPGVVATRHRSAICRPIPFHFLLRLSRYLSAYRRICNQRRSVTCSTTRKSAKLAILATANSEGRRLSGLAII